MVKLKFFNLGEELDSVKDGERIELKKLFQKCGRERLSKLKQGESPQIFENGNFSLEKHDHICYKNPFRWQKIISTIIFLVSGCVPDKLDLKSFYKITLRIRKNFKNSPKNLSIIDSPSFVFGALPYFLIAFDFTDKGWSYNGKNNIENLLFFIKKTISKENFSISTYLCAHREHEPVLSKDIDYKGLKKMVNIVSGIVENISKKKKIRFELVQPDGSVFGLNAVFPEIFFNYLEKGRIVDLAITLQEHHRVCKRYLEGLSKSRSLKIRLFSVDQHIQNVRKSARKIFGRNWKDIDEGLLTSRADLLEDINLNDRDLVIKVSNFALKDIKRLMPYYSSYKNIPNRLVVENLKNIKDPRKKSLVVNSINKFSEIRTSESKAIYETFFYFLLGKIMRKKNQVMIGFERDHDLFQTMAISRGYLGNKTNTNKNQVPLLYARRVNFADNNGCALRKISFRQFWRLSERNMISK